MSTAEGLAMAEFTFSDEASALEKLHGAWGEPEPGELGHSFWFAGATSADA